jgi:biopolymer transport protein ExbB
MMSKTMKTAKLLVLLLLMLPGVSQAWWNKDWKQRTQISLNTSAQGVTTQQPVNGLAIPVRLHSGNFDFVGAKPDGSDLRVVAGDDKTELQFWVERYDSVNELGVLWVQVPTVLPATDKNVFYVYAGNDKAAAAAASPQLFDAATVAAFHFAEKDGIAADQTGSIKAAAAVPLEVNGLIGQSAHPNGTAIVWPASDKLKTPPNAALSASLWIKPDAAAGTLFHQGALSISLTSGALSAEVGKVKIAGGQVPAAAWTHIALTIGAGKATLYVNGAQVGAGDLGPNAPTIEGDIQVGDAYQGLVDELEIANTARNAEWVKLAYAAQSADAKLIATKTQTEDDAEASSGSPSYFGILFKSLTPDAWVVIGILGVMFLIAAGVMVMKAMYVNRTETANRRFLTQFRGAADILKVENTPGSSDFLDSSLYRLYRAGLVELTKRDAGRNGQPLSGASIDAVKAAVDADSVREGYKLNAQMVLLTIAISGGPFLGLLGTVIGVMITFAAIAAAGDVNVNAIAPGIAAALLATVAGLSVAIPSLFGYNYLASRIKTISSDMQIFVDEFITRVAEVYGAR